MKPVPSFLRALSCLVVLMASVAQGDENGAAPVPPAEAVQPDTKVELGSRFESQSAGMSFCPPATMRAVQSANHVAEWSNASASWHLTMDRKVTDSPMPLVGGNDNFGTPTPGLLETTVSKVKATSPACMILRQDVTNIGQGGIVDPHHPEVRVPNVALITMRYGSTGEHYLAQEAIIQATSQLFYVITLTTPGSKDLNDTGGEDPQERVGVNTFAAMLDTVKLMDRTAIREDQDKRLLRTEGLIINFTPKRLQQVLIKEQWQRVLKDGKDVGYVYITEETAGGIPRKLTPDEVRDGKSIHDVLKPGDGILIGIRARLIENGMRSDKTKGEIQTDSVVWYWASSDRQREEWTRLVVSDDHINPTKAFQNEMGNSDRRIRPRVRMSPIEGNGLPAGNKRPEPVITTTDDYKLEVVVRSNQDAPEPLTRQLPAWYLPQPLGHLLPRLMPLRDARSYLFASFVSKKQEVMHRYVDVLPEQFVNFNKQTVRAVPITDRLGIDGTVTTHYMSPEGGYLGSESREEKIVVLPTDAATLANIWKNANLTRPDGVEKMPAATPGTPVTAAPATLGPAR